MATDSETLLARMVADVERMRTERAEAEARVLACRQREADLELSIRMVREFIGGEVTTADDGGHDGADPPPALQVDTTAPDTAERERALPRWHGVSIREAGVSVIARNPGVVTWTEDIARTLLAEGYPYTNGLVRLRETLSTVLKQHIESKLEPKLEKAGPARFMMPQMSALGEQTTLAKAETVGSDDLLGELQVQ